VRSAGRWTVATAKGTPIAHFTTLFRNVKLLTSNTNFFLLPTKFSQLPSQNIGVYCLLLLHTINAAATAYV